ncbi:monocarboxylate transporter 7-like [Syngnathoides biaculeatus]|uniref:monocarboxylate transporter 7-like n=1 Tax=Syngnathoides biaculeatus TaxID=300417 RepID=UPI002ADD7B4C|nr:monocarboxylate transporter 7-like [Syngnathoides biaculeatus]
MVLCGRKRPNFLGPNIYAEPPDGGWGWVVAVAFFIVEIFTYGTIKSFGIFLQELMEEFGESNSRVSWIVSICVFVMTFNGPLSSVMTNRFGFQLVVMIGGVLISSGTIATSFTTSINQMYITYGLVAGLGYCLTFLPTVTILSQYFTRRRSLVIAIASTGEALSMFALAPAFSSLRDIIGWRHTMAMIGALQGAIIICGALLRPIIINPKTGQKSENDRSSPKSLEDQSTHGNMAQTTKDDLIVDKPNADNELMKDSVTYSDVQFENVNCKPEERTLLTEEIKPGLPLALNKDWDAPEVQKNDVEKQDNEGNENKSADEKPAQRFTLLDFSILKECSFIFYSLFGLFATLGFFAPQLYIIDLSVSRGVGRDRATYMLSTMAVAEIVGRFFIGWVLTRNRVQKRKLLVLLVCVISMTLDLVGFTLVTEFFGLAVCCAVYGFFMGTLSCTHIPMLAEDDVVGLERMSSAAGVYVFMQSFAGLAGPPLGGVLVDVTRNYGSAFYSCAIGMAVSAVFLGLVRPAKRGLLCKRTSIRLNEDTPDDVAGNIKEDGADKPADGTKASANVREAHEPNAAGSPVA